MTYNGMTDIALLTKTINDSKGEPKTAWIFALQGDSKSGQKGDLGEWRFVVRGKELSSIEEVSTSKVNDGLDTYIMRKQREDNRYSEQARLQIYMSFEKFVEILEKIILDVTDVMQGWNSKGAYKSPEGKDFSNILNDLLTPNSNPKSKKDNPSERKPKAEWSKEDWLAHWFILQSKGIV